MQPLEEWSEEEWLKFFETIGTWAHCRAGHTIGNSRICGSIRFGMSIRLFGILHHVVGV
jgi:hypothetical protein